MRCPQPSPALGTSELVSLTLRFGASSVLVKLQQLGAHIACCTARVSAMVPSLRQGGFRIQDSRHSETICSVSLDRSHPQNKQQSRKSRMSHWHLGALCRVLGFILASSSRAVAAPGCVSFQLLSCRTYFQGRGGGPDTQHRHWGWPQAAQTAPALPSGAAWCLLQPQPPQVRQQEGRCVP